MTYRLIDLDQAEPLHLGDLRWIPLRHEFGARAFGINAYRGDAGERVIEEHTEEGQGHEEVYVVIAGRARFVLDGEPVQARAGAVLHLPDPTTLRVADAVDDGTIVLAVGREPRPPFEPMQWEWRFRALARERAGDRAGAEAILRAGLDELPGDGNILYELARLDALAGRVDAARERLAAAIAAAPRVRDWAAREPAFEGLL